MVRQGKDWRGEVVIMEDLESMRLDPNIMNDVAKGLEKQYLELMATISKLIDTEKMMIIKKQYQELKSKKGY